MDMNPKYSGLEIDDAPPASEVMDEGELQSVLRAEFDDARDYHTSQLGNERQKAGDYYIGAKFGNEQEGRSSVVSTEVADTIEYVMPSLMRIFASTDEAVRFMPRGPEDVEAAEQASEYINWVLNNENQGFTILHNWFKDALLNKMGVVKYWWDEKVETSTEEYEGLSDLEFALLTSDTAIEVIKHETKIVQEAVLDQMSGMVMSPPVVSHGATVRRSRKYGCIKIDNVPPEEFFANRRARSLEDARAPLWVAPDLTTAMLHCKAAVPPTTDMTSKAEERCAHAGRGSTTNLIRSGFSL